MPNFKTFSAEILHHYEDTVLIELSFLDFKKLLIQMNESEDTPTGIIIYNAAKNSVVAAKIVDIDVYYEANKVDINVQRYSAIDEITDEDKYTHVSVSDFS